MKIDISDLTSKKVESKKVNTYVDSVDFIYDKEEIKFAKPVFIEGEFILNENLITFEGVITTTLILSCSRCLEKFEYPIQVSIAENFSREDVSDEEIIELEGNYVDFTQIIEKNIILELPIKKLCKENCNGLCPICGSNLNKCKCNCERNEIDTRFEKLKDFFSAN
ncbi:YceD family protein [Clostridium sp. DL1XJH146]